MWELVLSVPVWELVLSVWELVLSVPADTALSPVSSLGSVEMAAVHGPDTPLRSQVATHTYTDAHAVHTHMHEHT